MDETLLRIHRITVRLTEEERGKLRGLQSQRRLRTEVEALRYCISYTFGMNAPATPREEAGGRKKGRRGGGR